MSSTESRTIGRQQIVDIICKTLDSAATQPNAESGEQLEPLARNLVKALRAADGLC